MKTRLIIFALVIGMSSIIYVGCKKESTQEKSKQELNNNLKGDPAQLIVSFDSKLKSHLKATDSIPTDSVDWYLCASINYQFGDGTAKGMDLTKDTIHLGMPVNGNYAQMDDVRNIYEDILDSLRVYFYLVDPTNRHLLTVVVKTTRIEQDQITMQVVPIIVSGNFPPSGFWEFGEEDDWKWWNGGVNDGGYCPPSIYAGTATESDAAIQLHRKVMFRKPIPTETFCYIGPFENISIWPEDYPNPSWNSQNGYNYERYLLYYNDSNYPNFHGCISYQEMNFYLTGLEYVIYTHDNVSPYPGACPQNLSFVEFEYSGDGIFPNPNSIYLHLGIVHYGTVIQTSGLPDHL